MTRLITAVSLILINFLFGQQDLIKIENKKHLQFADSLFNNENYFNAITEYKRLIFLFPTKENQFIGNYKIALSYKAGGFFDLAENYLRNSLKYAINTYQIFSIKIELLKLYILKNDTDKINLILRELISRKDFVQYNQEKKYWMAISLIFSKDYSKASRILKELNRSENDFKEYSINLLKMIDSVNFNVKNENTYKFASAILPGMGQILLGKYSEGIFTFLWNAFWLGLSILQFNLGHSLEGITILVLPFLRFYLGNIENTEKFVQEYNNVHHKNLLRYLQEKYKGPKP